MGSIMGSQNIMVLDYGSNIGEVRRYVLVEMNKPGQCIMIIRGYSKLATLGTV